MHAAVRFVSIIVILAVPLTPLAAQTPPPPPPGTPPHEIQGKIDALGLRSLLRSRIAISGLTPEQIRQRLVQMGYDSTTLDPYLQDGVATPPEPGEQVLTAARSIGVLEMSLPTGRERNGLVPVPQPGEPAPGGSAARSDLPPPSKEERDEGLRVFGLDVFARATTQFQPVTTGPVPSTYVVGPGDELVLILTGDVELSYALPVTREGFVVIPQVGQIWVNGLTLEQLRQHLYRHLGRAYSGINGAAATTHFDVTLGRLRTNQIFVTGEVAQPGSYVVSPVASVLNALYLAGGPTANGSFRDVHIVRGGRIVHHVDLFDYLLRGNNLDSIQLQPGDAVFVPMHDDRVAIRGEVMRAAIYEVKPHETLYDLIQHAGGVTTPAHLRRVRITRILPPAERRVPGVDRVVMDVDLGYVLANGNGNGSEGDDGLLLEAGDDVRVFAVRSEVRNVVTLTGSVWHEGSFGYRAGMRAWDLIRLGEGLKPEAYASQAHLVRLSLVDSTLSVIPFSLDTLPDGAPLHNPELQEFDALEVFSRARFEPRHRIEVRGAVRTPGEVDRFDGMTFRDAVLRAGGLIREAYTGRAFISRLQPDSTRRILPVELQVDSLMIPLNTDRLEDFDIIEVYGIERFSDEFPVTIGGEVRQPRSEKFQEGMTLRDLIVRAGGLKPTADLTIEVARLAAVADRPSGRIAQTFRIRVDSSYVVPGTATRFYLGDRDALSAQLAHDASAEFALRPYDQVFVRRVPNLEFPRVVAVAGEVRFPGSYALERKDERLRNVVERAGGLTPTAHAGGFQLYRNGRLVNIELPEVLADPEHRDNIMLLAGDSLVIPEYSPVVMVEGAVNSPSTVLYHPGADLEHYIENAGGFARNADRGRTHVRFANGSTRVKKKFLFFSSSLEPGAGSVITVPAVSSQEKRDTMGTIASLAQIVTATATLLIVALTR